LEEWLPMPFFCLIIGMAAHAFPVGLPWWHTWPTPVPFTPRWLCTSLGVQSHLGLGVGVGQVWFPRRHNSWGRSPFVSVCEWGNGCQGLHVGPHGQPHQTHLYLRPPGCCAIPWEYRTTCRWFCNPKEVQSNPGVGGRGGSGVVAQAAQQQLG
jgi:hypothetical protein